MSLRHTTADENRKLSHCHSEPRPEQRPERSVSGVEGRSREAERSGVKNLMIHEKRDSLRFRSVRASLCSE